MHWFTADWHLGHANILRFEPHRPWATTEEMTEHLVAAWNCMVQPADDGWFLGDVFYRMPKRDAQQILNMMNGRKHLIIGNHDGKLACKLAGWESQDHLKQLVIDGQQVTLCHYPLLSWPGQHRGGWMLHGHSHGHSPAAERRVDVGIDVWRYYPVTFGDITRSIE